ncbi:MAG: DUF1501 domain-containing protein [Alphaproteobacteria bacterium]|nr:DUF1501 domain-containing protein [Alphaproteobacteria bacterium]
MTRKMIDTPLSRRLLLQSLGGMALLPLCGGLRVSFAAAPGDARFVFIILRGAMDGLAAAVPYGDKNYAAVRGNMALPKSALVPVDNFFALHKSFESFGGLFKSGEAAVVHAVSTPYRERSHFDAQNVLECGAARPHGARDGWLNRALDVMNVPTTTPGLAVGQTIPLALQGRVDVGSWSPAGDGLPPDALLIALQDMYSGDAAFESALSQAIGIHDIADDGKMGGQRLRGGNARGRAHMESTIKTVGKIIADPNGPRIATLEIGGWDTHAQQGLESGALANNFATLDAAFGALKDALGPFWSQTIVLAATEFGRTVAGNGTGGTDHGTASCALIAGGRVNGGKVYAQWPGLDKTQLHQGRDLHPTTDLRQVAKAVLQSHLGLAAGDVERHIFPESGNVRPLAGLIG